MSIRPKKMKLKLKKMIIEYSSAYQSITVGYEGIERLSFWCRDVL